MENLPVRGPSFLESIINHVALPPKLPSEQDHNIDRIEEALVDRLLDASRILGDLTAGDLTQRWERVRVILQSCKAARTEHTLNKASLLRELQRIDQTGALILHIKEQNAGLLIRLQQDDSCQNVVFEAFEASPLPEAVLAAANALQWDFPACAVAIPYLEFQKPSFQSNLALFLERASTESIKRFAAKTHKAGTPTYESRGTGDPSLITQMLMTLLEANGRRISPQLLRKRVRDDVTWTNGARDPWRRCAFWLVLRVGLERHLRGIYGSDAGRVFYKFLLCLIIARLIDDSLHQITLELLALLRGKLARRLTKLEVDRETASGSLPVVYEAMFSVLGPLCRNTMKRADDHIEAVWEGFKIRNRRPVNLLPRYADQQHLRLTLHRSGPYLEDVLSLQKQSSNAYPSSMTRRQHVMSGVSNIARSRFGAFSHRYFSLSRSENENELIQKFDSSAMEDLDDCCIKISREIERYLSAVKDSYDFNTEEKSIMLLTIMEMWMHLDQCATQLFGLLLDFNPAFTVDILNPLQLLDFKDMSRLQKIELYIKDRHKRCNFSHRTIFDDPVNGCFAERFFDDSQSLQKLRSDIEANAESDHRKKEQEWRKQTADYERRLREIAASTCNNEIDDWGAIHHPWDCQKCSLTKDANAMRIKIHEHPLPSNLVQAKAVVFELGCPDAFAAYRTATWRILGSVATAKQGTTQSSFASQLYDYSELKPFLTRARKTFSIASTTKSHLVTHYSHVSFPATHDDIFRPNGLKFAYYDTSTKVWPSTHSAKFTFTHHCRMIIPPNSPFSSLQSLSDLAMHSNGPSSNEIVASLTKCPLGLNVHEFMAFQALLSGKHQRWPSLLAELGSSNLNFSTDAAVLLIARIALEAGPSNKADPLRAIHRIFRDETFCKALLEQIHQRLEGMSSNWRESKCMDALLTIALLLWSIGFGSVTTGALRLIEKARSYTLEWTRILRTEIRVSTNAETSQRASQYAFWAALLCRRTISVHAEKAKGGSLDIEACDTDSQSVLEPGALHCFIESSIILQEMIVDDPLSLPLIARNALVRDLKLVHQMRFALRRSLELHPQSLESAINRFWPQPDGYGRSFSRPEFLKHPNEWWVQSIVYGTKHTEEQLIQFHLLEGHLLVDGQVLGKLPEQYRGSAVLEQLFDKQTPLTFPSGLPGMKYAVAVIMNGHQIHLGFRNNALVARALVNDRVLELIPHKVFGDLTDFDLPGALVDNCTHWLDLDTNVIEIRRPPDIWVSRPGNWHIDLQTRVARRRNKTSLLDPRSTIFKRLCGNFDSFEDRRNLLVFQPDRGCISVELHRLELSFFVNRKHLLQCKQLRSEIDPNQDIGTFYGLKSQVVMRDIANPKQRCVVVPLGPLSYQRRGCHVNVEVRNDGIYGRFTINEVLGRLECPPEPILLHMKARLHSYTSFVVPDPLTSRTGAEEALHSLKSGYCNPWQPLSKSLHDILPSISHLTPKREYYPKGLKVMQRVYWDPHLTTTIQQDSYLCEITRIYDESVKLSSFALDQTSVSPLESRGDPHLLCRSSIRRRLYVRPNPDDMGSNPDLDVVYETRGRLQSSTARNNVFECVSILRKWPSEMWTTKDLAGILQTWPIVGGYDRSFDKILLSDCLDLALDCEWGALVTFCRALKNEDQYQLMFLFGAMSFRSDVSMQSLRTLLAYAVFEDLKSLEPPTWSSYTQFRQNHTPSINYLIQLIKPCGVPYAGDLRSTFDFQVSFRQRKQLEAAERQHNEAVLRDCKVLAQLLFDQWPCPRPTIEGLSEERPLLVDVTTALEQVLPEWLRLYQNIELSDYTEKVQFVLNRHFTDRRVDQPVIQIDDTEPLATRCRGGEFAYLSRDLICKSGPIESIDVPISLTGWNDQTTAMRGDDNSSEARKLHKENVRPKLQMAVQMGHSKPAGSYDLYELEKIIAGITKSKSTVRQQYGRDLKQSLGAFKSLKELPNPRQNTLPRADLPAEISKARRAVSKQFDELSRAFEQDDSRTKWLKEGRLWPCITTITLLEHLRSTSAVVFGRGMKQSLVAYAISIAALQRLLRIEDCQLTGNQQKLREEQQNLGHQNWSPFEKTDWLLLEIDANITIRPNQVDVAVATISPASGSNSVLQMNMGQGKTSCIMPMVAAVLADTKRIVRIVVPKALLLQTAQLLQSRIGGLLGRRTVHVPFSRKTPTEHGIIDSFLEIHREIMASSGVIVALPEHVLSFNLSGLQRLSDGRIPEATKMINIQSFLRKSCRDILDECDFTLAVRTQLIYPSGSQTTVDGHPHRWEAAEALLRLVEGHLWSLQKDFPRSIEVVRRLQGGFPLVFFLRGDVEEALIKRLVEDVLHGETSLIPEDCTRSDRQAIKHFISDPIVRAPVNQRISKLFPDEPAFKKNVYLLRGLLVHRILLLVLRKRWNVQYGIHPLRDPIAVPFHAKGVPSDQAEWGHPDVAILFTALSFYYGGITLAQVKQSVEHVLKSDDPSSVYDRWTNSSLTLPDSLREWSVINVDDQPQLTVIWQHLRYSVVVIDYFMNNFVFPKHAKQFRMKLQASGWDIPVSPEIETSDSQRNEPRPLTTGFSGTNDNRNMMPLNIKQDDLKGLSHTNAEVLMYLLQPRNRAFVLAADRGRHISEIDILHVLKRRGIRILIDAGAMILENNNKDLAKSWLKVDTEAAAAVYFNRENKACVQYRAGDPIPLSATPFADNLEDCVVYLDEAHTRGTDLKMPANATGALTLGLGQTKDHTVQAAMRLRQLGTTQSVVFFAPPEVHQSILDVRKKKHFDKVDSADVVAWLLEQTCNGIEQLQPLHYIQGVDFCNRTQAALSNPDFVTDSDQRSTYLEAVRQNEKQSLEELYGPKDSSNRVKTSPPSSAEIAAVMKELNTRKKSFQDTGHAVQGSALQEVEQEREVAFEVETVREVQKPIHYSPLSFPGLHSDIESFVKSGRLTASHDGYEHVLEAVRRTSLGRKHGIKSDYMTSKLYVSREFSRTVRTAQDRPNDNFLRDVHWVVWSVINQTALILIPEEAELVSPLIRDVVNSPTHLLTYAAPVTRRMLHFNDLTYYAVPSLPLGWVAPSWLIIELGIFAGRLYFEFEEYAYLRHYLGFRNEKDRVKLDEETSTETVLYNEGLGLDGAADEADQEDILDTTPRCVQSFTAQPLTFLQKWLALRRKGQDFSQTPMGYVCQGKPLTADNPFFSRSHPEDETESPTKTAKPTGLGLGEAKLEGDAESDDDFDSEDAFHDCDEGEGAGDEADMDRDRLLNLEDADTSSSDDEEYSDAR